MKWARPAIVVLSVFVLGALNANSAARALGTFIVLVIIWGVLKEYRPTWTAGWSGAWLFITGLVTGLVNGVVGSVTAVNPVAVGIAVSTAGVLPAFVIWKGYRMVSTRSTSTDG